MLLGALTAMGGCGDDGDGSPSEPVAGEASMLELTLDPDGPGGDARLEETVDCPDPPRPGADELCGLVLLLDPEDFDPVPADVACTEIYGGPDTLIVEGTLEGEEVEGEFTRANGCEIERFDTWVPILKELFPDYEPGESIAPTGA